MNDNVSKYYKEYGIDKLTNEIKTGFISAEDYQNLSGDKQYMEQIKWFSEFKIRKENDKNFDILKENIYRLLIVERPLYKQSILLTYPDGNIEIYDDAKEIAEKLNITWQKVNNYAFYKRNLNGIKFEKVTQKLFGNEYKVISNIDKQ